MYGIKKLNGINTMIEFEQKTGVKFNKFYEKYHPKLIRFLIIIGKDYEDAHDVATDAFMTAIERLDMFDPDKAAFSTWLFTIAKRFMIQRLRERNRFSSIESPNYDGLCLSDTLRHDDVNYEQQRDIADYKTMIVKQLIPNLPKKYADVLVLRHLKNYTYQDIAEELGVNLNTIKSRIRQARLLVTKLTQKEFRYIDSLDQLEELTPMATA